MNVEKVDNRCFVKLEELNKGDCFIYDECLYLMLGFNELKEKYDVVNLDLNYTGFFDIKPMIKVQKVFAKVVIHN